MQISWFHHSLFNLGEIPVTPLGLGKVILILLIAYLVGKFIKHNIYKVGSKHHLLRDRSLYILARVVNYVIMIIGLIIAGASLGLDLKAFAYIAGAITVWIGFSLQSIFHNFISGIIVLLGKVVNIGDILALDSGEVGAVSDINLRTTIITTSDGLNVIIPNSDLVTKKFINRTLVKKSRRITVAFRLALDVDKEFIKKILQEEILKAPISLPNPAPELWVMSYGENYLNCQMAIWVNESLGSLSNMSTPAYYFNIIDDTLRANKIEIPLVIPRLGK